MARRARWRCLCPSSTPDKTYVAEIYRDGDAADYRSERRFDLVTEQRSVTAKDALQLRLAPGGGQAIRFILQK